MTYGDVTLEWREPALIEDLCHETHVLDNRDGLAIADGDPGGLLAPVLQGEEPEIREVGDVLTGGIRPEHSTRFPDALLHRSEVSHGGS